MISAIQMGMATSGRDIRAWFFHPLIWKPLKAWMDKHDQELLYGAPVYEDWTVPEWPGVLLVFSD